MSKKDYERAAAIVQAWADENENNLVSVGGRMTPTKYLAPYIRESFVSLFADNPRFDAERFRRACIPVGTTP